MDISRGQICGEIYVEHGCIGTDAQISFIYKIIQQRWHNLISGLILVPYSNQRQLLSQA